MSELPHESPHHVIAACAHRGLTVATCESLTAGLVAATLATVPGASEVLRGGLITYATDLKTSLAGVDAALLERVGAVDAEVARQMAVGAARACGADVGVACTGVAGPAELDGKPVGTVFVAVAVPDKIAEVVVRSHYYPGNRSVIRHATVGACLELILEVVGGKLGASLKSDE